MNGVNLQPSCQGLDFPSEYTLSVMMQHKTRHQPTFARGGGAPELLELPDMLPSNCTSANRFMMENRRQFLAAIDCADYVHLLVASGPGRPAQNRRIAIFVSIQL